MKSQQYSLSFSTGGLFYNESFSVMEVYRQCRDWDETRTRVMDHNLLQARTESSGQRRVREIISRLALLTDRQRELFETGNRSEQLYILWIAVCKRYAFIHDFAVEVLREKFFRMDLQLTIEEYTYFFESKAEWHEELENLKSSTRKKLQQVLFKMMREAEIISTENMIIPALPTAELIRSVADENPEWLRVLPVSERDIQRW